MTANQYSMAVHAAFWTAVIAFAVALALTALGWLTGAWLAGFAGAVAFAVAAIVAVRWLELAERETPPSELSNDHH